MTKCLNAGKNLDKEPKSKPGVTAVTKDKEDEVKVVDAKDKYGKKMSLSSTGKPLKYTKEDTIKEMHKSLVPADHPHFWRFEEMADQLWPPDNSGFTPPPLAFKNSF